MQTRDVIYIIGSLRVRSPNPLSFCQHYVQLFPVNLFSIISASNKTNETKQTGSMVAITRTSHSTTY